jgi:hypothetical protein
MPALDVGLDYAWAPHPSTAAILGYGARFVARYLCTDSGKRLQAAERDAYLAAGIDIILVHENEAGGAVNGEAHGQSDGAQALAQARALGAPAGMTIYAAIDWNATPEQQVVIDAYLRGFQAGLGTTYVAGAYGGYWPLKRARDNGVIHYMWQTYAWSGGNWDSRAQLRQVRNGITVGGADCDRNERWAEAGSWLGRKGTNVAEGMQYLSSEALDTVGALAAGVTADGMASNTFPPRLVNYVTDKAPGGVPAPVGNNIATVRNELDAARDAILAEVRARTGLPSLDETQLRTLGDAIGARLETGLAQALGGMVAGIADSVATELAARLGRDA